MIEISGLHKSFGSKDVLRGIDLEISGGEALAIIGKSGCGKSVLLKHIVGLLQPDKGYVKIDGQDINKISQKALYKIRRNFGFLFQGAALFDSLSVEENVGLPLVENDTGISEKDLQKRISEKLELVGLPGIEKLKPSELSGGMRKRVGLARALITDPEFILYDEPTTGLDPVMSDSIDDLMKEVNEKMNVTTIMITHDMFSVKTIADKIVMIHEGKVYFNGAPDDLSNTKDVVLENFIKRTGF